MDKGKWRLKILGGEEPTRREEPGRSPFEAYLARGRRGKPESMAGGGGREAGGGGREAGAAHELSHPICLWSRPSKVGPA